MRAQSFKANFGQTSVISVDGGGPVIAANTAEFKNLNGTEFGSYRLGMNFREDRWGLGVTYRSEVTGNLKGKTSGDIIYTGTGAAVTGANAGTVYKMTGPQSTIEGNIPQQVNVDMDYDIIPDKLKILAGYSWTQYSKNEQLKIKGRLTNTFNNEVTEISSLNQKWRDLNDYKLALMWKLPRDVLSIGGTYSSAVTNKNYASANSAPPGAYKHYAAAWAHQVSEKLKFDLALEFYEASAKGKTEKVALGNGLVSGGQSGKISSGVYSSFMGLRYSFKKRG